MADENDQHETVERMTDQEVQEALRREDTEPETEQPEGLETMVVDTAFVVFVQDGVGYAITDIGQVEIGINGKAVVLESMKKADTGDLFRYCTEVAKDVQVSETATATVQQQMMMAQQMQQRVAMGGGPSGLHVPGR